MKAEQKIALGGALALAIGGGIYGVIYALTRKEAPAAENFVVSDLVISPSQVYPEEPVSIGVTVTNVGEVAGSYTVTCEVGDGKDDEKVTLNPGEAAQVVFEFVLTEVRIHQVSVDGLSGSFAVVEPEELQIPLIVRVSFEAAYYYDHGYLIWQGGTLSVNAENPDNRFKDWIYDAGSPGGAIGYSAEKFPGSDARRTGALVGYFDPTDLAHGGSQSWSLSLLASKFSMGIAMDVHVQFSARLSYAGQTVRLWGYGSDTVTLNI